MKRELLMSLIDKKTEDSMRQEVEKFIAQKRLEFSHIQDPADMERFEKGLQKMREQMERVIQALQITIPEED